MHVSRFQLKHAQIEDHQLLIEAEVLPNDANFTIDLKDQFGQIDIEVAMRIGLPDICAHLDIEVATQAYLCIPGVHKTVEERACC